MAHPQLHAKSSVKKFGGKEEDYIDIHNWFDETKSWIGHSHHRAFRHHSEGIFECEKKFGESFVNSDGKVVYTRYVGRTTRKRGLLQLHTIGKRVDQSI